LRRSLLAPSARPPAPAWSGSPVCVEYARVARASERGPMDFPRIKRLPPYVFNIVGDLKQAARRAGEDIIDLGMGNPDGATPPHVVSKLIEAAAKVPNHR